MIGPALTGMQTRMGEPVLIIVGAGGDAVRHSLGCREMHRADAYASRPGYIDPDLEYDASFALKRAGMVSSHHANEMRVDALLRMRSTKDASQHLVAGIDIATDRVEFEVIGWDTTYPFPSSRWISTLVDSAIGLWETSRLGRRAARRQRGRARAARRAAAAGP